MSQASYGLIYDHHKQASKQASKKPNRAIETETWKQKTTSGDLCLLQIDQRTRSIGANKKAARSSWKIEVEIEEYRIIGFIRKLHTANSNGIITGRLRIFRRHFSRRLKRYR